jgi:hypothetical protein
VKEGSAVTTLFDAKPSYYKVRCSCIISIGCFFRKHYLFQHSCWMNNKSLPFVSGLIFKHGCVWMGEMILILGRISWNGSKRRDFKTFHWGIVAERFVEMNCGVETGNGVSHRFLPFHSVPRLRV